MSGISDLLDLVDLPCGGGVINRRFALPCFVFRYKPKLKQLPADTFWCKGRLIQICHQGRVRIRLFRIKGE